MNVALPANLLTQTNFESFSNRWFNDKQAGDDV